MIYTNKKIEAKTEAESWNNSFSSCTKDLHSYFSEIMITYANSTTYNIYIIIILNNSTDSQQNQLGHKISEGKN